MIDYVVFQRTSVSHDDTGYRGYSFPTPNAAKRILDDNRVYLAMPKGVQTQYKSNYKQMDMGVLGAALMDSLSSGGSSQDLADIAADAANSALPEFASGTIANIVNAVSGAGNLAGNIDANAMQALTRGRIFNPFKEQVFTGIDFRTHSFNFKMFARSKKEAQMIKDIIDYFKMGSVPSLGGEGAGFGGAGISGNRFLTVPDNFNIKFMRLKPDGEGSTEFVEDKDFMHFKIHPSVCTNVSVNYTPDGQYTSFKDVGSNQVMVPAIQLNLSFSEMKLVTAGDVSKGF
jgi:hypothetical protein|tara:strand:+ start:2240 stop:3100 length:861 start_codon:yes stop_codon:yes gene_type:complete